MTTIAWRGGVLAADSQVNMGSGARHGLTNKIGRTRDGYLWGWSGDAHRKEAFALWAEKRVADPPAFDHKENCAVLIDPNGTVREWLGDGWFTCEGGFEAWGSGTDFALAAMEMGAHAQRAVEVACKFDVHSGGPICWFAIDTYEEKLEAAGIPTHRDPAVIEEEDGTITREWALPPVPTSPVETPDPQQEWREAHGLE